MNKKFLFLGVLVLLAVGGWLVLSKSDNTPVVIYSAMEEHRNAELEKQLKSKLPDVKVILQYIPTGNLAAKLKAEGTATEADIIVDLETGYLNGLKDILADHSGYDTSKYIDGLNPEDATYFVWIKYAAAIMVNTELLKSKGLKEPKNYEDLTAPEYKGLFIMPDPKTSGTAYMMLFERVKALGEEKAFEYFDRLQENVKQFTASGSAPVNALVQGESAVAWSLILKGVHEGNKGNPIKIIVPPDGAPFALTGLAMIKGKDRKESVKKVFAFLYDDFLLYDKEYFVPDKILKEQPVKLENYPENIVYADMQGIDDIKTKEHLLSKWKY